MSIDKAQLAREKTLFRYTGALERGDIPTLLVILRAAEADPALARMIDEINEAYLSEERLERVLRQEDAAGPRPLPNGHRAGLAERITKKKEDKKMHITREMDRAVWPGITRPAAIPFTLIAAVVGFALLGTLLLVVRSGDGGGRPPIVPGAAQQQMTATPTATNTATPTLTEIAIATPTITTYVVQPPTIQPPVILPPTVQPPSFAPGAQPPIESITLRLPQGVTLEQARQSILSLIESALLQSNETPLQIVIIRPNASPITIVVLGPNDAYPPPAWPAGASEMAATVIPLTPTPPTTLTDTPTRTPIHTPTATFTPAP